MEPQSRVWNHRAVVHDGWSPWIVNLRWRWRLGGERGPGPALLASHVLALQVSVNGRVETVPPTHPAGRRAELQGGHRAPGRTAGQPQGPTGIWSSDCLTPRTTSFATSGLEEVAWGESTGKAIYVIIGKFSLAIFGNFLRVQCGLISSCHFSLFPPVLAFTGFLYHFHPVSVHPAYHLGAALQELFTADLSVRV